MSTERDNEFRVWAPSRGAVNGSLALKAEALPRTRVAEPVPERRPNLRTVKPREKRRTLLEVLRSYKVVPKAIAAALVLAAAFAMIFAVSGFSSIAATQKQINKLEKQIEEAGSMVDKLNVDLLFSVDPGAAHEAARDAGMDYPTAANFGR